MSRNLGALTLLDPSGPAWPVMGVLYLNKMKYLGIILDNKFKFSEHIFKVHVRYFSGFRMKFT
jgi:hypothetical protein